MFPTIQFFNTSITSHISFFFFSKCTLLANFSYTLHCYQLQALFLYFRVSNSVELITEEAYPSNLSLFPPAPAPDIHHSTLSISSFFIFLLFCFFGFYIIVLVYNICLCVSDILLCIMLSKVYPYLPQRQEFLL